MESRKIIAEVRKGTKTKYITIPIKSDIEVGDYVVITKLETQHI